MKIKFLGLIGTSLGRYPVWLVRIAGSGSSKPNPNTSRNLETNKKKTNNWLKVQSPNKTPVLLLLSLPSFHSFGWVCAAKTARCRFFLTTSGVAVQCLWTCLNCFCFLCNLLTKRERERERERHTHTHTHTHGETDREMIDLEQPKKLGDETENNSDEGGEGRGEERRGGEEDGGGGVVESLDNSSYY